ncbi:MAG TPA: porin [Gallionella sp.]|nr:porin [Gallionella sp.]
MGGKLKFKIKASRRIIALALLASAGTSYGATPTAEELQKQIDELKEVISTLKKSQGAASPADENLVTKDELDGLRADLENYKYDNQRNRDTKTALTKRGTTVSGTVQVRANATSRPVTTGGATTQTTPRYSSFDVPLATLAFAGSLYKDYGEGHNLDYKLGFGYSRTAATTTAAAATSTFSLQDAYLQYNFINPTVTGLEDANLNLRFGQQQTVFGLEAQTTDELKPAINAAQFVSGLGVGTRQIGLILRGDYEPYVDYGFNYRAPLVEYAVGVVNGSGPNQPDNNSRKDYLARLAVTAPVDYTSWLRELKFGVSYQHGTKNILAGTAALARDGTSDRYGFDIYYNHLPFGATYEYAAGYDETFVTNAALPATASNIAAINTGKLGRIKSVGQTLTLFYTWGEQWLKSSNGNGQGKYDDWWPKTYQPFVRIDRWDPNTANNAATGANVTGKTDIYTLGFNLFFAETTKFQVNLNSYKYHNSANPKYRDLIAQFQFGF